MSTPATILISGLLVALLVALAQLPKLLRKLGWDADSDPNEAFETHRGMW